MSPIDWMSDSLTTRIVSLKNIDDDDKIQILHYGLYVIISDIVKNLVLLISAYLLGLLVYAIFTYVSVGLLKSFVGGVHSKTFWGCLLTNTSLILGISYLSTNLSSNLIINPDPLFFLGSFLIALFTFFKFAPADIANKPINSKKQRKKFRFTSYIISTLFLISALYFKTSPFSYIMIFALLVNSLTILPLMYKLTKNKTGEFYSCNIG